MKILFIHDFPAYYDKNENVYYSTGFPYSIWERYLKVFDDLKIISRYKEIREENHDYNQSSGEAVTFAPIKEYKSIKSLIVNIRSINQHLTSEILKSDGVIIRLPSVLGFITALICQKAKKPYAVEVVGSMFDAYWNYGGILSKLLAFPGEFIQKKSIRYSSVAIYITNSYLQHKYPTEGIAFSSVSNVVLENSFENKISPKYDIKMNPTKLGLVGSTFVNYKGHDIAIEALSILRKRGYNVTLDLVGQGLSEKVKNLINKFSMNNYVYYKGIINKRQQMNDWYKSLDIYLQPSRTEGHGRAAVEAISNGVTVIASDVGGLPDSIQKEYLFPPKDPQKLANLISKCIDNKIFRRKNIDGNIEKVKKYKSKIVESKRTEALTTFKNLLGGNSK